MSIRIICPGCGTSFRVADNLRGRNVRCPKCHRPAPVVEAPAGAADSEPDSGLRERAPIKARKGCGLMIIALGLLLWLGTGSAIAAYCLLDRLGGDSVALERTK